MTQRQLDLALLAGIGVLLVVILILALSGAPTTAGDISDPVDRVTTVESAEEGVAAEPASEPTPVVTTGDVADSAVADTVGTSEEGATTVTDVGEAVAGGETSSQDAIADATDPVPPAGGVRLERIGFAYATGSEGACGVPLAAWGYVALSRDLLDDFPCGTAVTLTLDDEIAGRQSVTAQVGDTMGAEVTGAVNIFVGQDEPALEYGVTGGTLSP